MNQPNNTAEPKCSVCGKPRDDHANEEAPFQGHAFQPIAASSSLPVEEAGERDHSWECANLKARIVGLEMEIERLRSLASSVPSKMKCGFCERDLMRCICQPINLSDPDKMPSRETLDRILGSEPSESERFYRSTPAAAAKGLVQADSAPADKLEEQRKRIARETAGGAFREETAQLLRIMHRAATALRSSGAK